MASWLASSLSATTARAGQRSRAIATTWPRSLPGRSRLTTRTSARRSATSRRADSASTAWVTMRPGRGQHLGQPVAHEVVGVGDDHAQALGGPVILADHVHPSSVARRRRSRYMRRWGTQAANRLACALVAELTHSSIVIAADPADIMDIIADVEAYGEWIPGIDKVDAHGVDDAGRPEEATFTGNLGLIKDTYTVAYDWAETEVSWHLTKGEMLSDLQGTYTCTDLGDGTTTGRVLPGSRARRPRDRDAAATRARRSSSTPRSRA